MIGSTTAGSPGATSRTARASRVMPFPPCVARRCRAASAPAHSRAVAYAARGPRGRAARGDRWPTDRAVAGKMDDALVAPLPAFADPARREKLASGFAEVDRVFAEFHERERVPGVAYGVVVDGELVHQAAWACAIRASGAPADAGLGLSHRVDDQEPDGHVRPDPAGRGPPVARRSRARARPRAGGRARTRRSTPRPSRCAQLLSMASGLVTDDPWADRHLDAGDAEFSRWMEGGVAFTLLARRRVRVLELRVRRARPRRRERGRRVGARLRRRARPDAARHVVHDVGRRPHPRRSRRARVSAGGRRLGCRGRRSPTARSGRWEVWRRRCATTRATSRCTCPRGRRATIPTTGRCAGRRSARCSNPGATARRSCPSRAEARRRRVGADSAALAERRVRIRAHRPARRRVSAAWWRTAAGSPASGRTSGGCPITGSGVMGFANLTYARSWDAVARRDRRARRHRRPRAARRAAGARAGGGARHGCSRLYERWDDDELPAVAADNVFLDLSLERRRSACAELREASGPVVAVEAPRLSGALRGTWRVHVRAGGDRRHGRAVARGAAARADRASSNA